MAETPTVDLIFGPGGCPDCGKREARLPQPLPAIGDDFDWTVRDFDGYRRVMLEELAARFPERTRWTPADMEVVIVELLATLLDQLSDMADRVAMEGYLETARHPRSVRRLLEFIGFDAVAYAAGRGQLAIDPAVTPPAEADVALEKFWLFDPYAMDAARREGPARIDDQERAVTLSDYARRLEDHPLVERAHAWSSWSGSWDTISVAVILRDTAWDLEDHLPAPPSGDDAALTRHERLIAEVDDFHRGRGLSPPDWGGSPAFRSILRPYLDAYRMSGQEVLLRDAVPVGIAIVLSLVLRPNYFRQEVLRAAEEVLGKGPNGFFAPGRLRFGEDLFASDLLAMLLNVEGVENVCLIRFKRVGNQYADQADSGHIALDGIEIAVCDNDPEDLSRGYFRIELHGGISG